MSGRDAFVDRRSEAEFLGHSLEQWRSWSEPERSVLANSLYPQMIYKLRNPLLHGGLWCEQQPCTIIPEEYWVQVSNLGKINQRLVPALLGFASPYVSSTWSSRDLMGFDPAPRDLDSD